MEDYGHDEPREGPARLGLYHPHGAASHGVRLSAPHAVWPLDRGWPVAYRARHLDRLYVASGGDICRGGVVSLVYRTALGAFESLDTQMLDAARTLGWSSAVSLPSL